MIVSSLTTYVQKCIKTREVAPRKVPTHLEITGRKFVTTGVANEMTGIKKTKTMTKTMNFIKFLDNEQYFL